MELLRVKILSIKNLIRITGLALFAILIFFIDMQMRQSLLMPAFFTGWLMFFIMCMLLLFNVRKKISVLPLGSVYKWTQFHIYGGILISIIFLIHINLSMPSGVFDILLGSLFLIVVVSGLYGVYISRRFPAKMMLHSDYVIFERLPNVRERIRNEVEKLVNESINDTNSVAIADFYSDYLFDYLSQSKDFWSHIFTSKRVYNQWQKRFDALRIYLNDSEKEQLGEIQNLTRRKTDIDSEYTYRSLLKYWLFIHIPFSYALFVATIIHIFLGYGFSESGL